MIYWEIAILILSIIAQVALAPHPAAPKPAAFSDIEVPQIDEGTPEAVVFGDVWSGDWMVLAMGNFRTTAIKQSSGKKG